VVEEAATAGAEKQKPAFLDEEQFGDVPEEASTERGDDSVSEAGDVDADGYPVGRVPEERKASASVAVVFVTVVLAVRRRVLLVLAEALGQGRGRRVRASAAGHTPE
jgi:hypothetical protein